MNNDNNRGYASEVKGQSQTNTWLIVLFGALLSALFCLPSMFEGLRKDDLYHRSLLTGEPFFAGDTAKKELTLLEATSKFFVFFGPRNSENLAHAVETGGAPWWTDSRLNIAFWRPLAAVTHWLDYQLWPDSTSLMHLHNVVWYFLLLLVWGVCLIKIVGLEKHTLLICLLLFGLDASHSDAVSWIANRNILLASTFGFLSLLCFHNYSRGGAAFTYLLSLLFLAFSLLSAEGGISIVAYLVSYSLFLDKNRFVRRVATVLPMLILVVVWRVLYTKLGYGAGFSGGYFDPVTERSEFLTNMLIQIPILLMDQITAYESLTQALAPEVLSQQAMIAGLVVLLISVFWLPFLSRSAEFRFLVCSGVLAVLPAGSTIYTGGRLMFIAGAGLTAALGMFVVGTLDKKSSWYPTRSVYAKLAIGLVWLVLLVQVLANSYIWFAKINAQIASGKKPTLSPYADVVSAYNGESKTVIVLNPPMVFDFVFLPPTARYLRQSFPQRIVPLVPGGGAFTLMRTEKNTIELEALGDSFYISPKSKVDMGGAGFSHWYATHRMDTFFAGNLYDVSKAVGLAGDVNVKVMVVNSNGLPKRVQVVFGDNIESSNLQWLCWNLADKKYERCKLPPVGQSLEFEGTFSASHGESR